MGSIIVAALLTVIPSEPPTVENQFPVDVTSIEVMRTDGQIQTVRRVGAGRRIRVAAAERVVSLEMESCPEQARDALRADGEPREIEACWRALERQSTAIRTASDDSVAQLRAVLLGPRSGIAAAAAPALPELVGIVTEGGPLADEARQTLDGLGWSSSAEQLRRVPRARRPDLLATLGRHQDGRAFGLLGRAALESSIEAERSAAALALADYPEDAVQRLSNALEHESPVTRERAADALGRQDRRAVPSLRAAALALGETVTEQAPVAELVKVIAEAHASHLATRTRELERGALEALDRGDAAAASEALSVLGATDRARLVPNRGLRARLHLLHAEQVLDGPGSLDDKGRTAAEDLASAQALEPRADGLVDTALRLARLFIEAGYPASASRVLGPLEEQDERAAALRTQALREEVRRLVAAGDRGAARMRLTQLTQEGRSELAEEIDDRYDVRASGAWYAPASLALLLCGCVGFAVQLERRRRRNEFQLIESEQERGRFERGPYR